MRGMPILAAAAALFAFGLTGNGWSPVPEAEAQPRREARSQQGKASYYAPSLHGRRMANGERFNRNSNSAAHRTLPLGTKARVTNLENGRSATVEIEDRGPYKRGRIIDVSPRTAQQLGMKEEGTAPVRLTPIEVPEEDERRGRVQAAQR